MAELIIDSLYHPRPYQKNILKALRSGIKRAVWCVHRRGGKDVTILNYVIEKLIEETQTCYYVFPTYAQAKKAIWDAINIDGMPILNYVPAPFIQQKYQHELKIKLGNGSILQFVGSDNIDSLMGTNPKLVVFSEYAMQSPNAWDYLRPILKVNGGTAIFISTPRGKNHFYTMKQIALDNPSTWFYEELPITATGVLTEADMEAERSSGMSEELIQQEYYVSFDRGVEGSYYGKLMSLASREGRICHVPYETKAPVNTAFDIGYGDSTAIVFYQKIGLELRIIDYYEAHGEGVAHYAKVLQDKPYVYGTHYFPHDAGSGSFATGKTVQQSALEVGLRTIVLPRDDFAVGIEAVRRELATCYFDERKCKTLIDYLSNYHKKYNEIKQVYSDTPDHDKTSHGADAFRYMAMALIHYGNGVGNLTKDKIEDMRRRNYGY